MNIKNILLFLFQTIYGQSEYKPFIPELKKKKG